MIEYVVAENPDSRIIARAASILEGGGLVVSPTDTSWSVLCSIASKEGLARLKKLLGTNRDRPPTAMCLSISQASELCEVDGAAFRLMKRLTPGPYVFVLPSTNKTARHFDLRRAELGLRIPNHRVPLAIMEALGQPLLSVTAKLTMMDPDHAEPDFPEELLFSGGWELEDLPGVDLILDPGEDNERRLATVLDLRSGDVVVLREGAGPYPG
ncbi:MAG: L-threonylcarbamoyladenylate synthase [Clostridia bacterium]|jgi:tRNA threonylcarbamoyl adenosine modification protein (Sua5/YciO/YrdC/YwlC family)|nr:L-threonylcarbamoyladenylate synthase [Spirochaetia bacterium]